MQRLPYFLHFPFNDSGNRKQTSFLKQLCDSKRLLYKGTNQYYWQFFHVSPPSLLITVMNLV